MGATEKAGFNAKVQRNLGLDLVTEQRKSLQNFNQFTAQCKCHTHADFPTFAMADPRYAGLIRLQNPNAGNSHVAKGRVSELEGRQID